MTIEPGMPVWKGREAKRPVLTVTRDFAQGQGARETHLALDLHTGTHLDAPLHFVQGGATMDTIPLSRLIRSVKVFDLTAVSAVIREEHLAGLAINSGDFVLLKTRNSVEDILEKDFVFISSAAAQRLVDLGVDGVGLDALGVERDQGDHGTHHALLGAGIVIIEGLRLAEVPEGQYLMIAAPLKISGVEAAPARVLLTDLL